MRARGGRCRVHWTTMGPFRIAAPGRTAANHILIGKEFFTFCGFAAAAAFKPA